METTENLTKDGSQSGLLICHLLCLIINLFITTFLVAHIYSFNGDTYAYLFNVGLYNMFHYLALLIFYNPISKIVDRTNRVGVYRFSLLLKALFVVTIIFFGKQLASLLLVAGLLSGTANAFYYASYNVIKQEMVRRQNMNTFVTKNYSWSKVIDIICPILLGFLIDVSTYSIVAIFVLAICIIQLLFSLKIKSKRPENSDFNIKNYFKKLKTHPLAARKAKIIYIISFLYCTVTLTTNIINVCIMLETGSNFSLGALTSIFAILSIITLILVKKFTKPGKRLWLFIVCSCLPILAAIYFVINISAVSIIILNGIISITSIVKIYLLDLYRNGIMKDSNMYSEISEHQSVVEFCLNISRTLAFGLLMIIALLKSLLAFKILALITIIVGSTSYILLHYYEIKYLHKEKVMK